MATTEAERRALFERIVAEHGAALSRLAFGYEANPALRDELLQDIHVGIWRALPAFQGGASLRTWMYRVAHNTAISHVRRATRHREEAPPADPRQSLDSDLDALRALERLRAAIEELGALDREIVLLHLEELPQAEIASITGMSTTNISTRLARIKRRLSRHWEVRL